MVERRSLLQILTVGAVGLAGAVAPYAFSRLLMPERSRPRTLRAERNYLRPPGALRDEAAFIAACIGCGLCGEVCPPRCILFHDRDGGAMANTPYIDPEKKACTLCEKCMVVCPTESLSEVALLEVDMGVARIDRSACYPWVDQGICGACVSICPLGSEAIHFTLWNQYRPAIREGCVGCGLCVEVCPHPSLPIWIERRPYNSKEKSAA